MVGAGFGIIFVSVARSGGSEADRSDQGKLVKFRFHGFLLVRWVDSIGHISSDGDAILGARYQQEGDQEITLQSAFVWLRGVVEVAE